MDPPSEQTCTAASIPGPDAIALWKAFRDFLDSDTERPGRSPAAAATTFRELAGHWYAERAAPHMRARQPPRRPGALAGHYFLVRQLSGRGICRQGGRDVAIAAGDLLLCDLALPCDCTMGRHRTRILCIPRYELEPHLTDPELAVNARISAGSPVAALLVAYLDELWNVAGQADVDLGSALVEHTSRLVALALDRDASMVDGVRETVTLSRRHAALSLIDRSFTDPEFSPARLAAQLGISRRTLDRLFEDAGLTFSQCIRRRRLAAARRLLLERKMTVADVAYAVGFNELSTFNRAFRAYYGLAPRDLRRLLVSQETEGTRYPAVTAP